MEPTSRCWTNSSSPSGVWKLCRWWTLQILWYAVAGALNYYTLAVPAKAKLANFQKLTLISPVEVLRATRKSSWSHSFLTGAFKVACPKTSARQGAAKIAQKSLLGAARFQFPFSSKPMTNTVGDKWVQQRLINFSAICHMSHSISHDLYNCPCVTSRYSHFWHQTAKPVYRLG